MSNGGAVSSGSRSTSTESKQSYIRTYDPRLVKLVGAHGAMVFGQVKYWLDRPNSGHEHDGYHWIWKSGPELADELGLSKDQAKHELARLRSIELLVAIENPINGWDRTLWYRINEDHGLYKSLYMVQNDTMHGADSHHESADTHHAKGEAPPSMVEDHTMHGAGRRSRRWRSAPAIPETTTESTSVSSSDSTSRENPAKDNAVEGARDSMSRPGFHGDGFRRFPTFNCGP